MVYAKSCIEILVSPSAGPKLPTLESRGRSRRYRGILVPMTAASGSIIGIGAILLSARYVSRRPRTIVSVADRLHEGSTTIQRVTASVSRGVKIRTLVVCRYKVVCIDILPHCRSLGIVVGSDESLDFETIFDSVSVSSP
jgi:hypothetical protein